MGERKMYKVHFICVVFISIYLISYAEGYEDDEYYCKSTTEYQICRRCSTLGEDCEEPKEEEGCRCDNIALFDENYGEKVGGPGCKFEDPDLEEPVCYVTENSKCEDLEQSRKAGLIDEKWINSDIFISYEACYEENRQKEGATGNQKFLPGVRIIGNNLEALEEQEPEEQGQNASSVALKSVPYYTL